MSYKQYLIGVHGCDDSTEIFMDLSDDEADLITRMANLINETSTYGCMPTMQIKAQTRDEEGGE